MLLYFILMCSSLTWFPFFTSQPFLFAFLLHVLYCLLYFPLPLRSLPPPMVPFLIFDLQIHMYKRIHYIHNFQFRSHIYMKAHMEHLSFCLAFINIMIFSYIHFPTWLHFLQLHKIKLFYMYHIFIIQSFVDGWFCLLATVHSVVINMGVQVSL